jgi:hypothetical protein
MKEKPSKVARKANFAGACLPRDISRGGEAPYTVVPQRPIKARSAGAQVSIL